MLRGAMLLVIWASVTTTCALAIDPMPEHFQPERIPISLPDLTARNDTTWFGGDDGHGVAYEGGIWDWDTIVGDPLQGWTATVSGENPDTYFYHVTRDSFLAHADPCIPMAESNAGMLWCGIHEDDAIARDFESGMGYQNAMCQRAFSPEVAIAPAMDEIDLSFLYFHHSEPDYDFTHVRLLCFDSGGEFIAEHAVSDLTGALGEPLNLAFFDPTGPEVPAGVLPGETETIQLAFQMQSDGGWSDEDGFWDSPCGPLGLDDIALTVGSGSQFYDFEDSAQDWSFMKCLGLGPFMSVIPEEVWSQWLDELGIYCGCNLSGNALGFVDFEGGGTPPGLAPGHKEMGISGPVPRDTEGENVVAEWDAFTYLPASGGGHYRPGYQYYPYTTGINPDPHWSPRMGINVWFSAPTPGCGHNQFNLSTLDGLAGEPLPGDWDSVRICYEVYCSCDAFGTPPTVCTQEGFSNGSPLLDNLRVGLCDAPDAPPIGWMDGGHLADGFGQHFPTYLEPSDRGQANASLNLSMTNPFENDWLADTTTVWGPVVTLEEERWLAEFCFRIARKGARQDMVPAYQEWKARLSGDPEVGFISVLMDSCQTGPNAWKHKFCTYVHEDDPMFDLAHPDQSERNEILPDDAFVPGTRIEYYARAFWYNGGTPNGDYFELGRAEVPEEFELLPTMQVSPGEEFAVQWPSVLYIDADNRGAEQRIRPLLDELGLVFDQYDYHDASSNFCGALQRTYGLAAYNPGGYGNNGCTLEQLLGYRLILLNTGTANAGCMHDEDFTLFADWLATTACGLNEMRRAIIFDGDNVADVILGPSGAGADFLSQQLGVVHEASSYRTYNQDVADCVYLEPVTGGAFVPQYPGISLYGNGCWLENDYDVLGVQFGVAGALGNLRYYSYEQTGQADYVEFAQVVRENQAGQNWRSIVNGFSLHHLSQRGCAGEDCANDSACVVRGGLDLLTPALAWLEDPTRPFEPWRYGCQDLGIEEEENHLRGQVSHLYACRPNPFSAYANLRFRIARATHVELYVCDVGGRRIRTLVNDRITPGEQTATWDGLDDRGSKVGSGVYWTQMKTRDGYASSRRMLLVQ